MTEFIILSGIDVASCKIDRNGPCLFITENPQIIVKYLNKISKYKSILNIIQQNIEFNHGLKSKIDQIEREISRIRIKCE